MWKMRRRNSVIAILIVLMLVECAWSISNPTGKGGAHRTAELTEVGGRIERQGRTRAGSVALISQDAQGQFDNYGIDNVVASMGLSYDVYRDDGNGGGRYTSNLNLISQYDIVIWYNHDYAIQQNQMTTMENYLQSGGQLIVTGYDSLGSPNDGNLANLVRSSTTGDGPMVNSWTVTNGNHPIMNGPYGHWQANTQFNSQHHDHDQCTADGNRGAAEVASVQGNDKIIATELQSGGKVVYWNGNRDVCDWRETQPQNMLKNIIFWMSGTRTSNVRLTDPTEDEGVCYSRYTPYTLSVNITTNRNLADVSDLKIYLDYNTTNATLGYNFASQRFYKLQDVGEHVEMLIDKCTVANDGLRLWWLNFSLMFNFTFPHEELVDCYSETTSQSSGVRIHRFPWLFRVENDLEFIGTPDFDAEYQGEITEGRWIRGNEDMVVSDLTVVYEDSENIYPGDGYFDVKITDKGGNSWWDNESSGEEALVNITSRDITDPEEEYTIDIVNIPGDGVCVIELIYPLKIDAEAPLPPPKLLCRADSFKGKETSFTDEPEMFVTWDDSEDTASGLLGYYYSQADGSGTRNGSFTNETETDMKNLEEGFAPFYIWCIDNVGNIGEATNSGILVDLTPPAFFNLTPDDGSWHSDKEVECTVEVFDGNGSGVDGKSVEYSVSLGGAVSYGMWMPAMLSGVESLFVPTVRFIFAEGEDNYVKWRAKDISGNGYVESFPVNIKVDITPVKFSKEITGSENWYGAKEITSKITVSDEGMGVNLSALEARVSTSGAGEFGEWMKIEEDNVTELNDGEYELHFTAEYAEGGDNYVMFRGTDLVGNSYSISDKFNLKVDTSPVYFGDFIPDGESYSDEQEVECFIQILDDGSGVNVNSVEYSISKKGPEEEHFGAWKRAQNVVGGNPTQVLMELKFDWGRNNYIRWRAGDKMGSGLNVSPPYRVWINSRPTPQISHPFPHTELWSHEETVFDARNSSDQDGDNLTFYWTSNVTSNRSVGSGALLSRKLAPGTHTITLHVNDGHGYNVTEKLFITVKEKEKKKEEKGEGTLFSEEGGIPVFIFIVMAVVLLLLILLGIWLVVRKKKKKEEEQAVPPMPTLAPYSPYSRPYGQQQGQYLSTTRPGYVQQGFVGAISQGSPPSAYPPVGGSPGQFLLPPGPQGAGSPAGPALPPVGTASQGYMLPSFTTSQGIQDFNRLALPPASVDGTQGHTGTPQDTLSPGMAAPTAMELPPLYQSGAPPSAGPPGAPAPAVGGDGLAEMEAFLGSMSGSNFTGTGAPPPDPTPMDISPPPPAPNELAMQCHACSHNYTATIDTFPAVVTCPNCQTQGMIEG